MQSSKPTYYSRFRRVFHEYYFNYPDCRTLNLHESHLSDNTLLGIRIVAFVYLTGIYIWALVDMPTLNTNLIFLTMLGYTATWLYFGLSLQDALIHKTNVISRRYLLLTQPPQNNLNYTRNRSVLLGANNPCILDSALPPSAGYTQRNK